MLRSTTGIPSRILRKNEFSASIVDQCLCRAINSSTSLRQYPVDRFSSSLRSRPTTSLLTTRSLRIAYNSRHYENVDSVTPSNTHNQLGSRRRWTAQQCRWISLAPTDTHNHQQQQQQQHATGTAGEALMALGYLFRMRVLSSTEAKQQTAALALAARNNNNNPTTTTTTAAAAAAASFHLYNPNPNPNAQRTTASPQSMFISDDTLSDPRKCIEFLDSAVTATSGPRVIFIKKKAMANMLQAVSVLSTLPPLPPPSPPQPSQLSSGADYDSRLLTSGSNNNDPSERGQQSSSSSLMEAMPATENNNAPALPGLPSSWTPLTMGDLADSVRTLFNVPDASKGPLPGVVEAVQRNKALKEEQQHHHHRDHDKDGASVALESELFEAAKRGDVATIRRLVLESKVDINAHHSHHGGTALHFAAQNGHLDAVRTLLSLGADVNSQATNLATPLHWAAGMDRAAVVEELLNCGADINATTYTWATAYCGGKSGQTAAHWAAQSGHLASLKKILDRNVGMALALDERGKTLLALSKENVHDRVSRFLEPIEKEEYYCVEIKKELVFAQRLPQQQQQHSE